MTLRRSVLIALACLGSALSLAAPAGAAALATMPGTVPAGFQPASTSWLTSQRGMVIGFTSATPGAKPFLLATGDGGGTWTRLTPPPIVLPDNGNTLQVTWADAAHAFVTDGTRIAATHDGAKHWTAVTLSGPAAAKPPYISTITVFGHHVFALVFSSTGSSARVFVGAEDASVLSPVPGLSVTTSGGEAYGALTSAGGGLQVDLGANYATQHYWISTDGVGFHAAPAPCPDTQVASLGGVRAGKVVALCSDSPSSTGPGRNNKRLWVAPQLGSAFQAAGKVLGSPNTLGFAATSAQDATVVTSFALYVTFDGGTTWAARASQPRGGFWSELDFPSASHGYVVVQTVTKTGSLVSRLYRTTDGGHTWAVLTIR